MKKFSKQQHLEYLKKRKARKIAVRMIPQKYIIPSQVIVYNNKVAITSLKKELITTLIENENIAKTFQTLFQYMWDKAKADHEIIIN